MANSDAKLQKVRHLTRKNPTLQKVFLQMLEHDPVSMDVVKETYELYQTYKNLLNNRQINIADYSEKPFEALFDDISQIALENDKRKYALSFVSKKYAHLLNEQSYDLFHSIKEMNLSHEKVNDLVVKKIAKYRTPEQFNEALSDFIESAQNTNINAIKQKIANEKVNVDIVKEDHTNNVLLAEIKDFPASKALGSRSWCISTNKSYFNSYTRNGKDFPKKQYFLWDFNRKVSDAYSFVAFTMDPKKNITASHKKDDSAIGRGTMAKMLKNFDIDIEPYPKEQIMEMVQTKGKLGVAERLSYVLSYMQEPSDKSYLKRLLISDNIERNDWKQSFKDMKSPKWVFEALEEVYTENKRGTRAFKNVDKAIDIIVLNNYSARKTNANLNYPIDLKLFWSQKSVESFSKEDLNSAKMMNRESTTPEKQNWSYTNHFNIDLLAFFRAFKKDESDYITLGEKQEVAKQIFRKYQHNIDKEVAEKFLRWSPEIFNTQKVTEALAGACINDIKTFNEITQNAQIDDEVIYNTFATAAIGPKVVKKFDNLEHLTSLQKEAISQFPYIPLKSYDEFKHLESNDIVSVESLKHSFTKVLKTALEDDIDLDGFKEMVNYVKADGGDLGEWKVAQTRAIVANDPDLSKSNYILSQSTSHKTAVNFLKASVPKNKSKMLDAVVDNMEDAKEAGALMNELLVKTSGPDTGVNKKEMIDKVFRRFSPNEQITPSDNRTNLSKYEATLVNIMDRNKDTSMISTIMEYLDANKRKELLLKTKKAKDPVVAFLLDSEECYEDPKPQQASSQRKNRQKAV